MNKKRLAHYLLGFFILVSISTLCLAQEAKTSTAKLPSSVLSLVTTQDGKQWQRYIADGEEFSVLMPEQPFIYSFFRPEQHDYNLSLYKQRKEMRMYGSYGNGAVYVVMSADNPEGKEPLDVFINEFPQYPVFHSEMTYERDVTRNKFKGRQYRVKSTRVSGIVQFYQTKNHVYIFEVVGDDLSKPLVEQFLSKLTLDGKTKGKDMAEGFKEAYFTNLTQASPTPEPNGATSQTPNQKETFAPKEVTRKAFIIVKAEPQYTEEARKHSISGTVVLRAVLSSSGMVTNIRGVSGLPYGLTQRAIVAARLIKFIPAVKDGKYVSQYIQIEYNFNLY